MLRIVSVDMSGTFSSGCHDATFATLCCSECTSSSQENILRPSFFAASHIIYMISSLSTLCMGLLSMMSLPILFSRHFITLPQRLSQEMLSCVVTTDLSRLLGVRGAARNTRPLLPAFAYIEAIAIHVYEDMVSAWSIMAVLPFARLYSPIPFAAIAMRSG